MRCLYFVPAGLLAWGTVAGSASPPPPLPVQFIRGDAGADGALGVDDAIVALRFLFSAGERPSCEKAADVNDDGEVDIVDPILTLLHLFASAPPPGPPHPGCGVDPTEDGLPCLAYAPCEFESLVSAYGDLTTIAGTGLSQDVNGWEPRFEGSLATEAELSNPHFAMSDDAGNIYIADKEAHAVRKLTLDGRIHTVAGTNAPGDGDDEPGPGTERALSNPNGLWVRGDSTVYILDLDNGKIRRLDPSGTLSTLFRVPGGILVGRGLWVSDDEGVAYVASNREIKRWTPSGGVELFASGLASLGNIVMGPDGHFLATDRGANRVWKIDDEGEISWIAGNGDTWGGGDGEDALATALFGVRGVWLLPTGGYLLATHQGSQVWYVDTRGIIHLFLDGAPGAHSGDGEHFRSPGLKVSEVRAVTVDAFGNIIVTEHDFGYLRKIARRR